MSTSNIIWISYCIHLWQLNGYLRPGNGFSEAENKDRRELTIFMRQNKELHHWLRMKSDIVWQSAGAQSDCTWLWAHLLSQNNPNYNVTKLILMWNHHKLRFQFTYKRTAPFCVSITTQFKALALLFLLWEVHKYWLSCQIIRIINVNPVVDLALMLFSSVWHSWKVTPCHTMQTWSYLLTAGSGSLCSVHISSFMPFPPAVRLELTNSAGIIGD